MWSDLIDLIAVDCYIKWLVIVFIQLVWSVFPKSDHIKRHPLYLNKLYCKGFLRLNQLTPIIFQQTSSWCRTLRSWSGRRRRCRRRLSNIRFLPRQVFRQDSEKKLLNCDSWSFFIQWKPLNVISLGPRKSDKNYRIQKILIMKASEFS